MFASQAVKEDVLIVGFIKGRIVLSRVQSWARRQRPHGASNWFLRMKIEITFLPTFNIVFDRDISHLCNTHRQWCRRIKKGGYKVFKCGSQEIIWSNAG